MKKSKLILISAIGNAIEFYDFTLYGVFASIISLHFFPSTDPTAALLASWAAFGVGFLMRPFGGSIFGYIGDKLGRKKALTLSILLMGVPTLVIGFVPSYASIGLLAPFILFLCRLLQGICTGGEYNGAAIYALEHLGRSYPGLAGGIITGSCVVGALSATFLGKLVLGPNMPEEAWRIPFLCGALFSLFGFYMRRDMLETPDFSNLLKTPHRKSAMPLLEALSKHPRASFTTVILGGFNGALSYTLFGFLNMYISRYLGLPMTEAMHYNLLGLFAFMISSPLLGFVLDKLGPRLYFSIASLLVLGSVWSVFTAFQKLLPFSLIMAQISLGILTGSIAGPMHAYVQRLFPVKARYSGVSFSFSLGMGVVGGITPLFLTHLIEKTHNLYVPALWLGGCALLAFFSLFLSWDIEYLQEQP